MTHNHQLDEEKDKLIKIKTIFENIPIAIHYWKKKEDDFVFWGYNGANNELAGGILEDSIGKKASSIHKNEPHLIEHLNRCFEEKEEKKRLIRYKFENSDKTKYLQANYKFIPPDLVVITTLDITKQKHFEKKLKDLNKILEKKVHNRTKELEDSEQRFRALAEQALIGMIIVQNGEIIFFNEKYAEIMEYDESEIEQWNMNELIQTIHQEDRDKVLQFTEKRQKGINDIPNRYEARVNTKSGESKWVEVFAKSINYDHKPADFVSLADITERKEIEQNLEEHQEELNALIDDLEDKVEERTAKLKESEKKYRSLFNNAVEGLAFHKMVYDSNYNPIDYVITDVNPSFERLMNNKKKYIIDRRASEVYGMDPPPLLNVYAKVAETGQSKSLEYYFLPRNKYFRISAFSFKKGTFITLFDDITHEKLAEIKLRASKKKFKKAYNQANFYKDLFAHDMNNILQNINSASELVQIFHKHKNKEKKFNECIDIMREQVKRGAKLINNVQKISKIEESKPEVNKIDLCEILNQSIDMLNSSYKDKDIKLNIERFREEIYVHANNLLEDVFDNLLINAVKHGGKKSIKIDISIDKITEKERDFVRMEFIDDGKGIKDDQKKKIFKKGYNSGLPKSGMGLGLYLVKKIIKSFDGKISVENRVKGDYTKGTKFILLLPLK